MKLIKLTDQNCMTHNTLTWGERITHKVKKVKNPKLCSSDVIHAYKNLNLAILINPNGANYNPFRIWEAEGDIVVEDWGKVGVQKLTMVKELPVPEWYVNEELRKKIVIQFAILCAESVISIYEKKYPKDDRPRKAIEAAKEYLNHPSNDAAAYAADAADAAAYAADAAAYAAADAAAYAAARAARAAADAAADAADAAADAAAYAADAADAAARAARAAGAAARAAARAASKINFSVLADEAVILQGGVK